MIGVAAKLLRLHRRPASRQRIHQPLTDRERALRPADSGGCTASVFAFSFGIYANILTENDGDKLRKPITIHYWNNVFSMVLGYLAGEGVGGP